MIRRLALLACLGVLALPGTNALGIDASVDAESDGSVQVPASNDLVQVGLSTDASADSSANVEVSPSTVEIGADSKSTARDALSVVPGAQSPQTAAAVASVSVLLGLAAYYWGQIKFATLGALVPLFSRIQPNHMLDNEVRNRVHTAVQENPGITIKEIVGLCGIGWGTAVYHLKRLEQERLIVSERHRQFRRYYRNGGGIANASKSAYGELKNPTGQRIAATILSTPGRCQKELCQAVGISPPLAHKYLTRLTEAGLVESQREWKSVKYFPTAQLQDLFSALRGSTTQARPSPVAIAVEA